MQIYQMNGLLKQKRWPICRLCPKRREGSPAGRAALHVDGFGSGAMTYFPPDNFHFFGAPPPFWAVTGFRWGVTLPFCHVTSFWSGVTLRFSHVTAFGTVVTIHFLALANLGVDVTLHFFTCDSLWSRCDGSRWTAKHARLPSVSLLSCKGILQCFFFKVA
jgi:hypothetical protein